MQRLLEYASGISGTGTYCVVDNMTSTGFPASGAIFNPPSMLAAVTFQITAGAGVTGGTVQPLILCGDGTYRPYGSAITLTAAGPNFVSLLSPVLGAAIQVTVAITGGTAYLEVDAVLV